MMGKLSILHIKKIYMFIYFNTTGKIHPPQHIQISNYHFLVQHVDVESNTQFFGGDICQLLLNYVLFNINI